MTVKFESLALSFQNNSVLNNLLLSRLKIVDSWGQIQQTTKYGEGCLCLVLSKVWEAVSPGSMIQAGHTLSLQTKPSKQVRLVSLKAECPQPSITWGGGFSQPGGSASWGGHPHQWQRWHVHDSIRPIRLTVALDLKTQISWSSHEACRMAQQRLRCSFENSVLWINSNFDLSEFG